MTYDYLSDIQDSFPILNLDDEYAPDSSLDTVQNLLCDPRLSAHELGVLGERVAALMLTERRGWKIIDTNWRSRYGELDIVALTPHRTIVFVEVKTRRTLMQGTPAEAVTVAKQMNIRRAATQWLGECGSRIFHIGIRFDVITLTVTAQQVNIDHIPEAF